MFFCPNCGNSYDITKPSQQKGGGKEGEPVPEVLESETPRTVSTQEETPEAPQTGGAGIDSVVQKILDKQEVSAGEVQGLSLDQVKKASAFKKLDKKNKERVFNTISDLLPKKKMEKTLNEEEKKSNIAFFKCTNCGHMQQIQDGTKIYTRVFGVDDKYHINRVNPHMADSNILLRTRRYTCPQKECASHKDPAQREAVTYRIGDSYMVGYMCTSCRSSWLN